MFERQPSDDRYAYTPTLDVGRKRDNLVIKSWSIRIFKWSAVNRVWFIELFMFIRKRRQITDTPYVYKYYVCMYVRYAACIKTVERRPPISHVKLGITNDGLQSHM